VNWLALTLAVAIVGGFWALVALWNEAIEAAIFWLACAAAVVFGVGLVYAFLDQVVMR
jgi:hypothetical protein